MITIIVIVITVVIIIAIIAAIVFITTIVLNVVIILDINMIISGAKMIIFASLLSSFCIVIVSISCRNAVGNHRVFLICSQFFLSAFILITIIIIASVILILIILLFMTAVMILTTLININIIMIVVIVMIFEHRCSYDDFRRYCYYFDDCYDHRYYSYPHFSIIIHYYQYFLLSAVRANMLEETIMFVVMFRTFFYGFYPHCYRYYRCFYHHCIITFNVICKHVFGNHVFLNKCYHAYIITNIIVVFDIVIIMIINLLRLFTNLLLIIIISIVITCYMSGVTQNAVRHHDFPLLFFNFQHRNYHRHYGSTSRIVTIHFLYHRLHACSFLLRTFFSSTFLLLLFLLLFLLLSFFLFFLFFF